MSEYCDFGEGTYVTNSFSFAIFSGYQVSHRNSHTAVLVFQIRRDIPKNQVRTLTAEGENWKKIFDSTAGTIILMMTPWELTTRMLIVSLVQSAITLKMLTQANVSPSLKISAMVFQGPIFPWGFLKKRARRSGLCSSWKWRWVVSRTLVKDHQIIYCTQFGSD